MGWTTDLEQGIAQRLDDLGAGTFDPDGMSGTIVTGALPDEITEGIGVTAYSQQPDPGSADVVQPVQLYIRGELQFVKDTVDLIVDNLIGAVGQVLGGVHCPLITLHSDVLLGVDTAGRVQRAVNLDVAANRPTPSRPD